MKSITKFAIQLVIALIVIFAGGWILMFGANVVAFIASPQMVAKFECPAGTTIQGHYETSSSSTESVWNYECLDQNGNPVSKMPPDQVTAAEYRFFYPPALAVMTILVIGWFVLSAIRGRSASDKARA